MEHLTDEQIFGFLLFLAICIILAIVGRAKQKRPTIPHSEWIQEIVSKCNYYGVSVRTFGDEDKANILTALYHKGHTPVEVIQEFINKNKSEEV